MPRFFFDVSTGGEWMRDEEGSYLADRETARQEAIGLLPNIARDVDVLPDGNRRDFVINVRDDSGKMIFTATFALTGKWVG